ncbi:TetR/AcrR family transcriptional regulator [Phycicoccus sp. MAQZ13P-2]|uniref:TetR/AcrR family transcriptional regulator n=1 Tax=Phycicoccus mangrovi TaxID=2840470 RepID=UPI001BFFF444|nr:TetR/AcrR family transcriptional regulator [Phycicoccus mangrovi]MBT9256859.1 TetR/AcrR family transcriptional regulator [Phycicoccus mangrovi]MBT9274992.1 TetR/AcrR family transcriptional regulator [Phycicoccus mangrovi]
MPGTERTPLSRPRVLTDAVALADAEGIEAVSMRRLAERLGVVPMALYKHVADKEDLLDGVVEEVLGEVVVAPRPRTPDDWPDAVRATVLSARAAVQRHPWLRRVLETRSRRTPAVLRHMDAVTRHLLDGGFTPDLAHHGMHALGSRIWGFSPELFDESVAAPTRRAAPAPDPADYPGILAVALDAQARRPRATSCDDEFEFRFALDLLLDGLERLRAAGWSSPGDAGEG